MPGVKGMNRGNKNAAKPGSVRVRVPLFLSGKRYRFYAQLFAELHPEQEVTSKRVEVFARMDLYRLLDARITGG